MKDTAQDERLLSLFAQLAASLMERGLHHARQDDPHVYAQALRWLQDGGQRFQLRTDIDPAGAIKVCGLVCDANGEAVFSVFTISGHDGASCEGLDAPL